MTTQHPLTTKCPHCGGELLTLTGVLVALDMQDPRSDALQALDVACHCEQSKLAQEQAKRELDALKRQETARLQAEALKARLHNSGLPEAWHDRALSQWQYNSEPRLYAREQAIAFGGELVLPCKRPRSLFIAGDIGTGKTFLASCLAADLIRRKAQVRWCNVGDVLRTIRSSFDRKDVTEEDTIKQFTDPCVLVLDDLGKERPTEWALEQLFSIINTRYDAAKPIIVTTNYGGIDLVKRLMPKGETDDTTARAIVDRLREMCKVIKLEGESQR